MNLSKLFYKIKLNLFDGGEGGGGDGSATGSSVAEAADLSNVTYGKQAQAEPVQAEAPQADETPAEDPDAEFESLIKGKYKDQFGKRTQQIINQRFKETKSLEAKAGQADKLSPILDLLATKYGVDGTDVDALVKAVQADDSYYEDEAMDKGLTVKQLKEMKALERENAEFKRAAEDRRKQEQTNRIMGQWNQQEQAAVAKYGSRFPGLQAEISNQEYGQRFQDLLRNGIDVTTAFEVIHKDELLSGAMQATAAAVAQKTANDIRARGMRPQENGSAPKGAVTINKSDPSKFTRKDREEISRRVLRGEHIVL